MRQKRYIAIASIMLGALALTAVSCDDDKEPQRYCIPDTLPAPETLNLTEATYSTLSFAWSGVDGAIQYGYDLKDAEGKPVYGGVTTKTAVTVSDLEAYTDYTLYVHSIPVVGKGYAMSAPKIMKVRTPFYPIVEEAATTCKSYLRSENGHEYKGVMTENRSYDGWQEGWYGYFTIKGFYGSKGNLTFKVNKNNTITILNDDYTPLSEDKYDENGWAKVATGYNMPPNLKTLFVDESSSLFDPINSTLTFTAKLSNSDEDTETITW